MNFAHTDYFKYFIHFSKKKNSTNHKKCLLYMLNDLKIISNDKLIIPTYNYSFGEKKIFNLKQDKSEVGFFSEFVRKRFIKNRSLVPMFSSCSTFRRKKKYSLSSLVDPFDKHSDFGLLMKKRGKILFFGANFAPTFLIYIERNFPGGVPYRINKIIEGKILLDKRKRDCNLIHYVRPKKIKILYDLKKIKDELIKKRILSKKISPYGFLYEEIKVKDLFNWGIKRLKKDKFFFLTQKSKKEFNLSKNYEF